MRKPSTASVTAFGKVRFEPEFIGSIVGESQVAFAEWLDEGIGHAMDRGGEPWREAFQRSAPLAFVFRPPPPKVKGKRVSRDDAEKRDAVLLGVIGPSQDSFGRPFPFSVITEMREAAYANVGSALPVAAERFLAEASVVSALARTTSSAAAVLEEAERKAAPNFGECAQAAEDLRKWSLQDQVLGKVWARLFPRDGAAGASQALRVLIECIVPVRSRGALATARSVRLPLGRGGAVAAAFWVEIIRVLAGWARTFPAAFWPADRADGEVLVCLGEVTPPLFGQLWSQRLADPLVLDATSPADVDRPRSTMAELDRLVKDPSRRVTDLLDLLARVATPPGS